jgi:hypothetical protein
LLCCPCCMKGKQAISYSQNLFQNKESTRRGPLAYFPKDKWYPCILRMDLTMTSQRILVYNRLASRSQWPCGLRHELSSLSRSWDRGFESQSKHGCLCVRLSCVCVVLCVGSGLATGLITRPRSPTVCVRKITKLKKGRGPKKGCGATHE